MSYRNRTPRMAALLLSAALGAASLSLVPAAEAAPQVHVAPAHPKAGDTSATTITRVSATKGSPGQMIIIAGTNLAAEEADENFPELKTWKAKTVKFGDTVVAADRVTVLGFKGELILVTVPKHANGTVTLTVGDAAKGVKFTYNAPVTVDITLDLLEGGTVTTETGATGLTVEGTNFSKTTKVLVGGKPVKITSVATDGTKITFDVPAGLVGVQDVLVTDSGTVHIAGFVVYVPAQIAVTAASSGALVEANTNIELTGTNLDKVTSATYGGAKVTFKKTTDATKLTVTIPKGAALEDGKLTLTTKYGATATIEIDRAPAPTPTVTAVSTVTASTAGEITLTGTGLTGLKKVVIKNEANKLFAGSKFVVAADGKSAKVTFPALAAGTYTVSVTAVSATASTAFEFTVAAS
ncbi:IPT/TIG domain-containing protein [Nocardioides sp. SR21]|uniref:IPT/TIG domain-containing protein n=1 Tax=Nocardioides sp. SR21 TaxID=2919501 RepID=UPI001FA9565C|nr:IPT/TIG domain-containing protein [Nocardioides sp. SR21]